MMKGYTFLLQKDYLEDDIVEYDIIKNILNKYPQLNYEYEELTYHELNIATFNPSIIYIPIGSISFVQRAMRLLYDSTFREQPIEIPTYLQTEEFLKRIYKIIEAKDIPRTGRWFLKNASRIKDLSICTNMDFFIQDEMFDYKPTSDFDTATIIHTEDDYLISQPLNIKVEYRAYIINGTLKNIAFYKGNAEYLPDIKLIKKAIDLINQNEEYLKSYTIDIMVGDFGTALIEIHNFSAIGLYTTIFEDELLTAYLQGIEYYMYDNSIKYK